MIDHGKVRSTIAPEIQVIDETSVWVAANIELITVTDEKGDTHTEYEYNLSQYGKNEYIGMLENQLTDTQLALCDVYELLVSQ